MVIRSSDLPGGAAVPPWMVATEGARLTKPAPQARLMGQLLQERAAGLEGAVVGGQAIPRVPGVPVRIVDELACHDAGCFLRDRVFAVIADDGALYLRLPEHIADDLVENLLAMRVGRQLLTWPPQNASQLETQWRILQQAYWMACGRPVRKSRRMWSEWVANH